MNGDRIRVTGLVILVGLLPIGYGHAQGKTQSVPRPDWNTNRVVLDIRNKSWADVLSWFAEQAQVRNDTQYSVPGRLTIVSARTCRGRRQGIDAPPTYSLAAIFDILN